MTPLLKLRATMCVLVTGVLLAAGMAAISTAEAKPAVAGKHRGNPKASLSTSPASVYLPGEQLIWSGNIGVRGKRKVHLQVNMKKGGVGAFRDLPGNVGTTDRKGNFRFFAPAPGMWNVYMRVASGKYVTPKKRFEAESDDLNIAVAPVTGLGPDQVLAGDPFTINVDTTPKVPHRPDINTRALRGRTLTLQQRVNGDQWKTIGSPTKVDSQGNGSFPVTIDPLTLTSFPATITYRVRAADFKTGKYTIGWMPSFPLDVTVFDVAPPMPRLPARTVSEPREVNHASIPALRPSTVNDQSAADTNGWGVQLWDFAWEFGESLSSKPARGSDLKGYWADASDGSGRAAKLNGQLTLDSGRDFDGPGDYGTTTATLRGNPATYGRWEVKLRLKRFETGAEDYHAVAELVPDKTSAYHCGAQSITVADLVVNGSTVGIGARTLAGKKWSANRSFKMGTETATFGVEVNKDHITWFANGKTIGTVKSTAAVSDIPLTLRLRLVGDGSTEMNHTAFYSDWQRGWDLHRGTERKNGAALTAGTFTPAC